MRKAVSLEIFLYFRESQLTDVSPSLPLRSQGIKLRRSVNFAILLLHNRIHFLLLERLKLVALLLDLPFPLEAICCVLANLFSLKGLEGLSLFAF